MLPRVPAPPGRFLRPLSAFCAGRRDNHRSEESYYSCRCSAFHSESWSSEESMKIMVISTATGTRDLYDFLKSSPHLIWNLFSLYWGSPQGSVEEVIKRTVSKPKAKAEALNKRSSSYIKSFIKVWVLNGWRDKGQWGRRCMNTLWQLRSSLAFPHWVWCKS